MRLKEEQLRREEEKVRYLAIALWRSMLIASRTAARDRASGSARDQREEAGAFGERRVAQVSYTEMTSRARGAIDADYTLSGISRAGSLHKARSRSSASDSRHHIVVVSSKMVSRLVYPVRLDTLSLCLPTRCGLFRMIYYRCFDY